MQCGFLLRPTGPAKQIRHLPVCNIPRNGVGNPEIKQIMRTEKAEKIFRSSIKAVIAGLTRNLPGTSPAGKHTIKQIAALARNDIKH